MVVGKGRIRGGGRIGGILLAGICLCVWFGTTTPTANAEIVRRNLGKDAKGRTVSGYVFQPGRSYRHRTRSSGSVFDGRRDRRHDRRGIDYGYRGYGYPYYGSAFYYYIPSNYCYPMRPIVYGGCSLSVQLRF